MFSRRKTWIAALSLSVLLGTACGSDSSDESQTPATGATDATSPTAAGANVLPDNPDHGVTSDTIKIGWMGDVTGPTASSQSFNLKGVQAAAAWVNANGGVLGRELVIVDRDDQFNAEVAATNYASLIEDERVLALVGLGGAHISTALMPNVAADQIPVIGPPQTIDIQLDNDYVFNNLGHYGDQADVALAFMAEELGGIENAVVAVIQLELPSGDEWDLYVRTELEEAGGTYAGRLLMNSSAPDYAGTVTRLRELIETQGVNFVAIQGAPSHGLGLANEMASQDVSVPFMGIHGLAGSSIFVEGPATAAESIHPTHSFLPGTADCDACETIREFTAGTEWESAIGELYFGHGWLNVMVTVQAMEAAADTGELSRTSLQQALKGQFETGGLTCPIDWSSSNHSPCAAPFRWDTTTGTLDAIGGIDGWIEHLDGDYRLFEG